MEKFIHMENLALFKKRLAEPHTDAEREVLLKLLADEKAKEPQPKKSILKPLTNRRSGSIEYTRARPDGTRLYG
jgi:hypothetical protein